VAYREGDDVVEDGVASVEAGLVRLERTGARFDEALEQQRRHELRDDPLFGRVRGDASRAEPA
jgi:hypothetical protein